jgi:hypothetical protein
MNRRISLALSLALTACCMAAHARAQFNGLVFTSAPESVGRGASLWQSASPQDIRAYSDGPDSVSVAYDVGIENWNLMFATSGGGPLSAGPPLLPGDYPIASRWPFHDFLLPGSAGLSVTGNGSGVNTLTGNFKIYEIVHGAGRAVTSFAADFVQYDDGLSYRWIRGAVRVNSSYNFAGELVPEPSATVLALVALLGLRRASARRFRCP